MTEKEFINGYIERLKSKGIKKFPEDFEPAAGGNNIELPGKTLVIGEQFFGAYEILTVDGNAVYQASNHDEAKFIIYANREKIKSVSLPGKPEDLKSAVNKYEDYLDSIMGEIEKDYAKSFPGSKNSAYAVNEIFRALNLTRY